ncbi:MAG: CsbD family protein [Hyphomonadaceae bacterium]|nr:CsbD family protein [Hyphomonadaceae bacterium]
MNKEHVKSAADKASGAIKEGIGKATGDKSMEAKGKMDKAKGEAREALGDAKDALKKDRDDTRH